MSDLLIPDLDPAMLRALEGRARVSDRNVVEEARVVLRNGLGIRQDGSQMGNGPPPGMGFGTWLFSLVPPEFRGDDLVFDIPDMPDEPPDFA